jgi:uncharacterized protein YecA (UPF0149 family)
MIETNIKTLVPGVKAFGYTCTVLREGKKIGRNDACPCGSGKKYKKCCMAKEEAK